MATVLAPEGERTRIASSDELLAWVRTLPSAEGLAVDTETSGLAWLADVRLVQFGNSERGYAVDVRDQAGRDLVNEVLCVFRGTLIFHNAAFDVHRLDQIGIDTEGVWRRCVDTHVLAHVINPDRLSFRLKQLARVELGDESTEAERALKRVMKKRGWTWANVPLLVLTPYGVTDTVLTHQLYVKFCSILTDAEMLVVDREMDVRWAMGLVQWHGMRLDQQYANELNDWWSAVLVDQRAEFAEKYGVDNPNANRQLAKALIISGWEPTALTPSGEIQLDKKILEALQFGGEFSMIDLLMEYKRINKWRKAYVQNCLDEVDESGFVHASYNTLGAKTGRMSCSNPPLQQLPKGGGGEIRRMFIASPGNVIASCDYSAIEMRLAGALSGEPVILDAYAHDQDIYQQFADELEISRPQAKIFSLATLYGATANRHSVVFGWSQLKARKVVKRFWNAYPVLKVWNDGVVADARMNKPIISGWGRTLQPHAAYAAPNAVIQGTAAEVMKDGLLRLWHADLLRYVVAVVHDEVVLDVPRDEAEDIAKQVAALLEDLSYTIPLIAEASVYGESWGAGYAT